MNEALKRSCGFNVTTSVSACIKNFFFMSAIIAIGDKAGVKENNENPGFEPTNAPLKLKTAGNSVCNYSASDKMAGRN